jgi:hypothetical protein
MEIRRVLHEVAEGTGVGGEIGAPENWRDAEAK